MDNNIEFISYDVRKEPISKEESLKILRTKKIFLEKKGKKIQRFLHENVDDETLLKMFLGRSATLRAPVLAGNDWVIAGFEESTYRELLMCDE